MKLAILFMLLVVGHSVSAGSVESCVAALKADVGFVKQVIADMKAKDTPQIIKDIMSARSLLERSKTACSKLDPTDISQIIFAGMSEAQRNCTTAAIGIVFTSQRLLESAKTQPMSELAVEFFDSDKVLTKLLNDLGVL